MASVTYPSPELFAAVFEALYTADLYQDTVSDALSDLIKQLTDDEAEQLPDVIKGLLPLFRGDLARLRFAGEVLVGFDLFEAADELVRLAIEYQDGDLLYSAAALCGNPGIISALKDRVSQVLKDRYAQIMLYDHIQPTTAEEKLLYEQHWPGSRASEGEQRLAPVAVLDKLLPARQVVELAVHLMQAGAVVRRMGVDDPLPNWFGSQTIVLCHPTTRSRVLSYQPKFAERQIIIIDPHLSNASDYAALMRRCEAALAGRSRLRLPDVDDNPPLVWDPRVYHMGVYTTYEAVFLTSASRSSFYNLAKRGFLKPRRAGADGRIWSFSDLVGVRTWQYMKSDSRRYIKADIVPVLAGFAGDEKAVKLGVTSSGKILVDQGDRRWVDPQTGEQPLPMPITDLDDVFKPFWLGGNQAPNLLNISENTRVHPAILGGTPHRKDFRIPALVLAELHRRDGKGGVIAAYPKLKDVPIADTLEIGYRLAAARRNLRHDKVPS